MAGLAVMGRLNAWTSEVNWQTGQWQRREQRPTHHGWQRPSPRGVLAKRPLTFVEVLDSGFRLLRFVPGLTIGSALIVFTLWTLLIAAAGTLLVLQFLPFLSDLSGNDDALSGFLVLAQLGSFAVSLLSLGMVHLLSGLAASGTRESFGARKTSLNRAWASLRGRRLRLILATALMAAINLGLLIAFGIPSILLAVFDNAVLAVVLAIISGFLWLCAVIWLNLRFAFLGAAIADEDLSIRAALKRSWTLTRRGFWRIFGQLGLGYFLSNQLVQLIISPFVMVVSFGVGIGIGLFSENPTAQIVLGVIAAAIVLALTLISSSVLFAYFSCLVCVAFFDQQMRTEGFDLVLIRREEAAAR